MTKITKQLKGIITDFFFFYLLSFSHALKNINLSSRLHYGILLIKSVVWYIDTYLQY